MRRTWWVALGIASALLLAAPVHASHEATTTGDNVVVTNGGPLTARAGGDEGRVALHPARYYATRDGGFVGHGRYSVIVTRDGRSRTYTETTPCRPTGAIRVGDFVRIRVVSGVVAAGSRHHC